MDLSIIGRFLSTAPPELLQEILAYATFSIRDVFSYRAVCRRFREAHSEVVSSTLPLLISQRWDSAAAAAVSSSSSSIPFEEALRVFLQCFSDDVKLGSRLYRGEIRKPNVRCDFQMIMSYRQREAPVIDPRLKKFVDELEGTQLVDIVRPCVLLGGHGSLCCRWGDILLAFEGREGKLFHFDPLCCDENEEGQQLVTEFGVGGLVRDFVYSKDDECPTVRVFRSDDIPAVAFRRRFVEKVLFWAADGCLDDDASFDFFSYVAKWTILSLDVSLVRRFQVIVEDAKESKFAQYVEGRDSQMNGDEICSREKLYTGPLEFDDGLDCVYRRRFFIVFGNRYANRSAVACELAVFPGSYQVTIQKRAIWSAGQGMM